jgi:hypothetical protein
MVAHSPDRKVKFLRSKRGMAAILAFVLALFLFRPGVHELRNRISNSIGSALGRRVAIDNVRFHILPRPGFDLEGLVIYDAPAFSAEPMIRAQEVFAAIRLRSLLRGRLEIATLSATEPSINIVRNSEGRWNLASLIERNAQIPAAPTQKAMSERRPAFPYLEATNARINFKIGQEKKSYALTDADVALWQDSENSWGARMKAQPVRTDFNLTDTGVVQVNASWQRAANLRQTPLRLSVSWRNGQLGQLTQLFTGRDRGWRGEVGLTANLFGTPESLTFESRTTMNGFRRYDILDNRNVNLATSCAAKYNATTGSVTDLFCESPVKEGTLRLSGKIGVMTSIGGATAGGTRQVNYDLTIAAEKVPVASLANLLHEAKQQLPSDLAGTGLLDAEFHAVRDGASASHFSGTGLASDVRLSTSAAKDTIALGTIPLTLVGTLRDGTVTLPALKEAAKQSAIGKDAEPVEVHFRIGPTSLQIDASAPLAAGGWISGDGYRFFLRGDTELKSLFRLENILGLPAARPAAEGLAKLDVSVSGTWQGLAAPNAFGTAQLRNVRAETRGLNSPIEISSATVLLGPEVFSVQKLSAQTGTTHWSGSVTAPRHCAPACVFQFDLTADHLSGENLSELFTPHPTTRPWYRILSSNDQQGPSPFLALQAHGSLHVARLELKKLLATQVASQIVVDRGKLTFTGVQGQLLQGSHKGNWTIDAAILPPHYHGAGTLQGISLAEVATLMSKNWITGSTDGNFDLQTSGADFRDLLGNSDGKLQFVMRNGSLSSVEIPGSDGPFPVHRFSGSLRLKENAWQLSGGKLESRDGIYQVSGSATAEKGLDFVLTRGDEQSWKLTGTLNEVRVTPADHTEISRRDPNVKADVKP